MLEGHCSKYIYISYFSALSDNTAFPHLALRVLIFFHTAADVSTTAVYQRFVVILNDTNGMKSIKKH